MDQSASQEKPDEASAARWDDERRAPAADRTEQVEGFLAEKETASLHAGTVPESDFSALALRDRVVIMLLFDQVVREEQVELAWQLWHQMSREGVKEPLWRVFTLFPELDRDLIYAEAARVYGFEDARISRSRALALIHEMERQVDKALWDEMVELRVVPISEVGEPHTHRTRTVFATQDPTRPEVHRLMPRLRLEGFELRYAREDEILNLLIEAFPQRYNHLKGLSGVSKDFLASLAYSEEHFDVTARPPEREPDRLRDAVLDTLKDVLAAAVRQHATDVCLLPNPRGEAEVYFQVGNDLRRFSVVEAIPAEEVVGIIRREVIDADDCGDGKIQKRLIMHPIDDVPVRFRVSFVPAGEEIPAACIVIRVFS